MRKSESNRLFDTIAASYDQWYELPVGQAVFYAEAICLRQLGGSFTGRWLEIGVGTGRFASSLGILEGIDPSFEMLKIAAARGIQTSAGRAESLPFSDKSFDGIFLALSLCFIPDTLHELSSRRTRESSPFSIHLVENHKEIEILTDSCKVSKIQKSIYTLSNRHFRKTVLIGKVLPCAGCP
jgi:hypothetical protein